MCLGCTANMSDEWFFDITLKQIRNPKFDAEWRLRGLSTAIDALSPRLMGAHGIMVQLAAFELLDMYIKHRKKIEASWNYKWNNMLYGNTDNTHDGYLSSDRAENLLNVCKELKTKVTQLNLTNVDLHECCFNPLGTNGKRVCEVIKPDLDAIKKIFEDI